MASHAGKRMLHVELRPDLRMGPARIPMRRSPGINGLSLRPHPSRRQLAMLARKGEFRVQERMAPLCLKKLQ